jgi:membrane protease YdiL (CAAX protease family)
MKKNNTFFFLRIISYFLLPTLIGGISYVLATLITQSAEIKLLLSGIISLVLIAPLIYFILRYEKLPFKLELNLNPKIWILLVLIIALFYIFLVQVIQIELYFEKLDYFKETFFYKFKKPWNNSNYTFSSLSLIRKLVFIPVIEEFVFTFIIFQLLIRKLKLWHSLFLTAMMFGLIHLPYSFFPQFLTSLLFCYLFHKSRSIFIPIILHAGYNFAAYILVVYKINFSTHVLVHCFIFVFIIGVIFYLVKRKFNFEY